MVYYIYKYIIIPICNYYSQKVPSELWQWWYKVGIILLQFTFIYIFSNKIINTVLLIYLPMDTFCVRF